MLLSEIYLPIYCVSLRSGDVDVAGGYNNLFLPYFSHKPELAMMMDSFAAREAVHIDAYSLLIETLGLPDDTYQQFQSYKEMRDKHDYMGSCNTSDVHNVAKSLAIFSAFGEGMQLFASFVVLLNFSRFNKMKNMGNIVSWSIRDESLHVEGMTNVFKEFWKEIPEDDKKVQCKQDIKEAAFTMVKLEDSFVDLIYKDAGAVEGLSPDEVKKYIRFICNKRWTQLGFSGKLFDVGGNPLPWVDYMINGEEHTNFFEQKSTFYSKAATKGTMEDIQW